MKRKYKTANYLKNKWFITNMRDKVNYDNYNPLLYIMYDEDLNDYILSDGVLKLQYVKDELPDLFDYANEVIGYIEQKYPGGQYY